MIGNAQFQKTGETPLRRRAAEVQNYIRPPVVNLTAGDGSTATLYTTTSSPTVAKRNQDVQTEWLRQVASCNQMFVGRILGRGAYSKQATMSREAYSGI